MLLRAPVVLRQAHPNAEMDGRLGSRPAQAFGPPPIEAGLFMARASADENENTRRPRPVQISLATSKSRRNAENVLRSLTGMGLPADRITLSATSSARAQGNEVHVYVR